MNQNDLPATPPIEDENPQIFKQFNNFKTFVEYLTYWDNYSENYNKVICYQSFVERDEEVDGEKIYTSNYSFFDIGRGVEENERWLWALFGLLQFRNSEKGMCNSLAVNEFTGKGLRRRSEVKRVRAFVVDIDGGGIEKEKLEWLVEKVRPHFVVVTSKLGGEKSRYKAHLYWLVKKFDGEDSVEVVANRKLIDDYHLINNLLAYKVDKLLGGVFCDKSITSEKVLRCPGFFHQKQSREVQGKKSSWLVQVIKGVRDIESESIRCRKNSKDGEVGVNDWLLSLGIDDEFKAWIEEQESRKRVKLQVRSEDILGSIERFRKKETNFRGVDEGERDIVMFKRIAKRCSAGVGTQENIGISLLENEKNSPPLEDDVVVKKVISVHENRKAWLEGRAKKEEQFVVDCRKAFLKKLSEVAMREGSEEEEELSEEEEWSAATLSEEELSKLSCHVEYDYNDRLNFSSPMSERSICERVSQRFKGLIYSPNTTRHEVHGVLVYNEEEGRFVTHDGVVKDFINEVIVDMQHEKIVHDECRDKDDRLKVNEVKRLVKKYQSNTGVNSIASMLSTYTPITTDLKEFEQHDNLLLTTNGVVDLGHVEATPEVNKNVKAFIPCSPKYKMLYRTNCAFNEDKYQLEKQILTEQQDYADIIKKNERIGSNEGLWKKFIFEIMDGDMEMVLFLQRMLGYTIHGSLEDHKLFYLFGPGSNGKSTLLDTILFLMGDYGSSVSADFAIDSGHASGDVLYKDQLAQQVGKRFLLVEEILEGNKLRENAVKDCTTGAAVTGKKLYHSSFTYNPNFTMFLHGNALAEIKGTDHGIWRRIVPIPFTVQFEQQEESITDTDKVKDKSLESKLRQESVLEEILAWAIVGTQSWLQMGHLGIPDKCKKLHEEYRQEMNPLTWFIEEYFEPFTRESMELMAGNKGAGTPAKKIWELYQKACNEPNRLIKDRINSDNKFYRVLKNTRIKSYRNADGVHYCIATKKSKNQQQFQQTYSNLQSRIEENQNKK